MDLIERVARAIDDVSDEQSLAFMHQSGGPTHPTIEKCRTADREKRMSQARAAIEELLNFDTSDFTFTEAEAIRRFIDSALNKADA